MLCGERAYFVLVKESLRCWGVLRGRVAQGGRFRWPAIENSMGAYCQGSRNEKVDGQSTCQVQRGLQGQPCPGVQRHQWSVGEGPGSLGGLSGRRLWLLGRRGGRRSHPHR